MKPKPNKKCAIDGCNRRGETYRTYWTCGEHWNMLRFFDLNGDPRSHYILHCGAHGPMNAEQKIVYNQISRLKSEMIAAGEYAFSADDETNDN